MKILYQLREEILNDFLVLNTIFESNRHTICFRIIIKPSNILYLAEHCPRIVFIIIFFPFSEDLIDIILGNFGLGMQLTGKVDAISIYHETENLYEAAIAIIKTLPCYQIVLVLLIVVVLILVPVVEPLLITLFLIFLFLDLWLSLLSLSFLQ